MIPEKTIDHIIAQFEEGAIDYEQAVRDLGGRQPAVLSFLMADQEGALTDDERDFMLYLAVVIHRAVEAAGEEPLKASPEDVAEAEENNWAKMNQAKGRTFREQLDAFFKDTPQEDLLAFIEDSLTPDEEDKTLRVTKEGQEPMFVALKTVVDVLVQSSVF
ncbi:MAG TPA: hypothetical protein ENJ95_02585 [Bacteroidetes bacterium]|nr:hypothetical protein [Bacteroidota bacterium]